MPLIGFTGKMGCGKSTAIQMLKDDDDLDVRLVKFAQPLYDMQEYIYRRIHPTYTRDQDFVKDRKLLQWLGTDWGRDTIDKNLWVNIWKHDVKVAMLHPSTIVVCDDVRFDNEAEILQSLGGTLVKIESDKADARIDTRSGLTNHKSEAGVSAGFITQTIHNNGTMKEYRDALRSLYKTLDIKLSNNL